MSCMIYSSGLTRYTLFAGWRGGVSFYRWHFRLLSMLQLEQSYQDILSSSHWFRFSSLNSPALSDHTHWKQFWHPAQRDISPSLANRMGHITFFGVTKNKTGSYILIRWGITKHYKNNVECQGFIFIKCGNNFQ